MKVDFRRCRIELACRFERRGCEIELLETDSALADQLRDFGVPWARCPYGDQLGERTLAATFSRKPDGKIATIPDLLVGFRSNDSWQT